VPDQKVIVKDYFQERLQKKKSNKSNIEILGESGQQDLTNADRENES